MLIKESEVLLHLCFLLLLERKKLRKACNNNEVAVVESLLESGVDPNCSDERGRTPLHLAASRGNLDVVNKLLIAGANPNNKDCVGNTPLHLASCTSHVRVVTLLIKAGELENIYNHL